MAQRFESMRRVMGGFMPRSQEPEPAPAAAPAKTNDEVMLAALRRVEVIGRATLVALAKLEKTMANQNVSIEDIIAATREQTNHVKSLSALLQGVHARVNQLVAGQVSPQLQQNLNEAFAEIKGNTGTLLDAITTYSPDAQAAPVVPAAAAVPAEAAQQGPVLVPTSISISSSKNPANHGDSVSLSAHLSKDGSSAESMTGVVSFAASGSPIGTATLDSTGVAVVSVSTLPVGDNSISAIYSGDANFAGSAGTFVQSIAPAAHGATGQAPQT